ncbi:hypothetical protein [Veillonella magna]|uniref:hypothetical protein n=1 Tax=Veillonella magna TaxID=464322 RepID=UPI0026652D51|nr:hypothetical protein [Veillonella magna]
MKIKVEAASGEAVTTGISNGRERNGENPGKKKAREKSQRENVREKKILCDEKLRGYKNA